VADAKNQVEQLRQKELNWAKTGKETEQKLQLELEKALIKQAEITS